MTDVTALPYLFQPFLPSLLVTRTVSSYELTSTTRARQVTPSANKLRYYFSTKAKHPQSQRSRQREFWLFESCQMAKRPWAGCTVVSNAFSTLLEALRCEAIRMSVLTIVKGNATRMAHNLGLHMDCSAWVKAGLITEDEAEVRTVTWWGCFVVDK